LKKSLVSFLLTKSSFIPKLVPGKKNELSICVNYRNSKTISPSVSQLIYKILL